MYLAQKCDESRYNLSGFDRDICRYVQLKILQGTSYPRVSF